MTYLKLLALSFIHCCFSVAGGFAQQKASAPKTNEFVCLSDIHFNPFYDPKLVPILLVSDYPFWDSVLKLSSILEISPDGQDTNYPLLTWMMEHLKKTNPNPKYITITGDFLCHNFIRRLRYYTKDTNLQKGFINNAINYIAWTFNKKFPNAIVLPVLGNNDSYCGDYDLAPGSPFLRMFAKAWAPLQRNHNPEKDSLFIEQFSKGGYYTYTPKSDPALTFVMLNTIFFSAKYVNTCGDGNTQAGGANEMMWFDALLRENNALGTKANKFWVACHIPPGMDVFASARSGFGVMMWDSSYNARYLEYLTKYNATIVANLAGHTHMDDFRVVYDADKKPVSFVHLSPSISRSNGNNPGYQVFSYEQGPYTLTNYKTHFLKANEKVPTWDMEYDFNKQYGVSGVNAVNLDKIRSAMQKDTVVENKYLNSYEVGFKEHTIRPKQQWQCYWCGTGALTNKEYMECIEKH